MPSIARPLPLTIVTLGISSLALLISLVVGADPLSLVVGAATVAVAFALVVVIWFVPAQRAARRRRRRDLREARRARRRERQAAVRRAAKQERVTRRLVGRSERHLLVQLESRDWLSRELGLPRPLPPTRAYAASPDLLAELVGAIDRFAPDTVVELGAGLSTVVLARRLQQSGRGHLVTLEHLPEYAARSREELEAYGVSGSVSVLDAPLVDTPVGPETWPWYELGPGVPERIDMLVVDGPPGRIRPQARYPAMPVLRDRLSPGARVFVDDGDRPDERLIVDRWLAEIDGLEAERLSIAQGAWMLTMPR